VAAARYILSVVTGRIRGVSHRELALVAFISTLDALVLSLEV